MGRFKLLITEEERNRILSLHKRQDSILMEENGLLLSDYPPCVQGFGEPTPSTDGTYGGIDGTASKNYTHDWTNYRFFSKMRVRKPDGTMTDYFCKGKQPVLGLKKTISVGGATTTPELGGSVLKIGSRGDAVKQIQNKLVHDGHGDGQKVGGNPNCGTDVNSCDGVFGNGTAEAVKKFQDSTKIQVDGVVGDETWQQMFEGEVPEKPTEDVVSDSGEKTLSRIEKYREENPISGGSKI